MDDAFVVQVAEAIRNLFELHNTQNLLLKYIIIADNSPIDYTFPPDLCVVARTPEN